MFCIGALFFKEGITKLTAKMFSNHSEASLFLPGALLISIKRESTGNFQTRPSQLHQQTFA